MRKIAIIFAVLLGLTTALGAWLGRELTRPYRGYTQPQVFVDIPRGTSRWGMATLLENSGVIHSRFAFALLNKWHRRDVLQAGEYRFDHPMTPGQVLAEIVSGHIYIHTVVVPEGWTMFDIANELAKQGLCRRDDFLKAVNDPSLIRDIAPRARNLEGFLFPATYQFTKHTAPEEIAATMVRHFREEWTKLNEDSPAPAHSDSRVIPPSSHPRKEEDPQPLSTAQIVTLASLIERETPQPNERPVVASVFYNRLRLGVPLQCDPTVEYALGLAGTPVRNVSPEDLRAASPYNTYLHRGLPPGPIANPGDASLRAAIHPAHTQYLYFVANDSGGHFFSRTLAEHNRNVARYRRLVLGEPVPPTVKKVSRPTRKKPTHKHAFQRRNSKTKARRRQS
jgi:UPF0755 protein